MSNPWVEKYRPKKLSQIIEQTEIINVMKNLIITKNFPHLLFYGPPGTGKTSTIFALANEIFGQENINDRVIELNASDDRGINLVRNTIIKFAKSALSPPKPNYSFPPIKIIILDEADAMTNEAQTALRKIMEICTNTVFCFICNYKNQIIEPIESRCAVFRFKKIVDNVLADRLKQISMHENIYIADVAIEAIVKIADGDARKGIMILQNSKYIGASSKKSTHEYIIQKEDIFDITGCFDNKNVVDFLLKMMHFSKKININKIIKFTKNIIYEGYPIDGILETILLFILDTDEINDSKKKKLINIIVESDALLTLGSDEYLQLLNIFFCCHKILTEQN